MTGRAYDERCHSFQLLLGDTKATSNDSLFRVPGALMFPCILSQMLSIHNIEFMFLFISSEVLSIHNINMHESYRSYLSN